MRPSSRPIVGAFLALIVGACGSSDAKSDAKPSTSSAATTVTSAGTPAPSEPAASVDPKAAPKAAPKLAPGRTPVPGPDEWTAVTKEVTVKGSSALHCETKMLREYLRISCNGKNDTGGTPLSVVRRKGGEDAVLDAKGGAMNVVVPYVEGIAATFVFAWTDKTHPLRLAWPRGQKAMPPILGEFEGAKSPLDGASGDHAALCARCEKELADAQLGAAVCEIITSNPWCLATYPTQCEELLACGFGSPGAMVACPAGTLLWGTGHHCAKPCGGDGSCAAGTHCEKEVGDKPVCLED